MKSISLPAIKHLAKCCECDNQVEVSVFSASAYEYATYYGAKTKSYYRLNGESIRNGTLKRSEALQPASDMEGGIENVIEVPDGIYCPNCQKATRSSAINRLNETNEYGICLPLRLK